MRDLKPKLKDIKSSHTLGWGGKRISCHVSLTSVWRQLLYQLTSGLRSPDEADEAAGTITRLRFVWFSSNFVHLPPRKTLENRICHASHLRLKFLQFFIRKFYLTENLTSQLERMRNKGLQEDDIQKLHTTAPEQLTIRNYSSVQFLQKTLPGDTKKNWNVPCVVVNRLRSTLRGKGCVSCLDGDERFNLVGEKIIRVPRRPTRRLFKNELSKVSNSNH